METITHNLIAVYIQILCFQFFIFPFDILLTIIFAYCSHIIVDAFSILTYHTPDAHKEDKFWLYWHIIIYALSGLSIVIFIIPFWLSLIFANLMDIWDWFIVRPIQKRKRKKNPDTVWENPLYLHGSADWVRKNLLFWLPKWNYKKGGIVIEIIIILIFSFLIILNYI
ncbi:MAG: hypothetical protein EU542_08975 [Promethearchaeota archaeon]|nr:MAG: hypothetical protein EU542_08975 [Candidatus Lokiarchaeota archaeon]